MVTNLGGVDKLGVNAIVQVADTFNWENLAGQLQGQANRVISSDLENVNQTWGSPSSPEIVLINNARIRDSTITGYGILLLKNDVRLKDATNFKWEGLTIIYGGNSDFRCEIDSSNTTATFHGAMVLTGEDRRFDLDSGGKMNVYYSSSALNNVGSLFGSGGGWGGSAEWRLVRNY